MSVMQDRERTATSGGAVRWEPMPCGRTARAEQGPARIGSPLRSPSRLPSRGALIPSEIILNDRFGAVKQQWFHTGIPQVGGSRAIATDPTPRDRGSSGRV